MWRSLRTTNTLESLNREFRQRTKTQRHAAPGGRCAHVALWLDRLLPDRLAPHRWPSPIARVSDDGMVSGCMRDIPYGFKFPEGGCDDATSLEQIAHWGHGVDGRNHARGVDQANFRRVPSVECPPGDGERPG